MKRLMLLCLLSFSLGQAQTPSSAPSKPEEADGSSYRATVVSREGTPRNFTIKLRRADGTEETHQRVTSDDRFLEVFEKLEVGKVVEFPTVIGADPASMQIQQLSSATTTTRQTSGGVMRIIQSHSSGTSAGMNLYALKTSAPFRARVEELKVEGNRLTLRLICTDGRQMNLSTADDGGIDELRKSFDSIEQGGFYEFPHCLSAPNTVMSLLKPTTPEMKALSGWIGQWQVKYPDRPELQEYHKFSWKADGTGLWREVMMRTSDDQDFQMTVATLMTFDAERKCYIETCSDSSRQGFITQRWWDAETQTLTGTTTSKDPSGVKAVKTTYRFKGTDRIEASRTVEHANGLSQSFDSVYTRM